MTVNMVREEYRKETITPVGRVRLAYGPDHVLRHNDIEHKATAVGYVYIEADHGPVHVEVL